MAKDDDKRLAAGAAVAEVADGMLVGLGTGSTAAFAIAALGRRIAEGLRVEAVATSEATAAAARAVGVVVRDFSTIATLDLTIDGADEIDSRLFAIKGAGGAMLREKAVAAASRRMVVIADGSKRVAAIGAAKVPVEVLPFASASVVAALERLGAAVAVRAGYVTDNGNIIADCHFPAMPDPRALAARIAAIPGALGHGLFLDEVDAAYIAADGNVTRLERDGSSG
ncbi:ribose-5-phosphate isomerase RpiA [Sphingomonas lycopersici]|uniref:Ribose-5-phosphate isomerase A n=1 Tax=Sphingomonas lycopersici TaxID=2951807 RepID=A0AA41ZBJ4_9SPHN|nr:ribose-5-phosphate isomerase RpiA [Sphingomonas lycopersici]MCW6536131.1 ribose-5-phosphate isomerase RpiA [Sphingomonas lycopersici]